MPAVTRSLISDDSNSAMAPMMVNIARPTLRRGDRQPDRKPRTRTGTPIKATPSVGTPGASRIPSHAREPAAPLSVKVGTVLPPATGGMGRARIRGLHQPWHHVTTPDLPPPPSRCSHPHLDALDALSTRHIPIRPVTLRTRLPRQIPHQTCSTSLSTLHRDHLQIPSYMGNPAGICTESFRINRRNSVKRTPRRSLRDIASPGLTKSFQI
jgi:hypothetical protein